MPLPLVDTLQQLGNRKLGFKTTLPNFKLFGHRTETNFRTYAYRRMDIVKTVSCLGCLKAKVGGIKCHRQSGDRKHAYFLFALFVVFFFFLTFFGQN